MALAAERGPVARKPAQVGDAPAAVAVAHGELVGEIGIAGETVPQRLSLRATRYFQAPGQRYPVG